MYNASIIFYYLTPTHKSSGGNNIQSILNTLYTYLYSEIAYIRSRPMFKYNIFTIDFCAARPVKEKQLEVKVTVKL